MATRSKKICGGGKAYCVCCSNYSGKVVDGRIVKLHRLPTNKILRRAWEQRLRLVRQDYKTVNYPRVCSEHFVHKQGPKSGDNVPSVFPNRTFKICSVVSQSEQSEEPEDADETLAGSPLPEPALDTSMDTEQSSLPQSNFSRQSLSVLMHDYTGPVQSSSILPHTHCTAQCQTETSSKDVKVQTEPFIVTGIRGTGKSVKTQTDKTEDQFSPLRYKHVCTSDETVRLYTGIKDATTLQIVFDELPEIDDNNGNVGRRCALRPIDQFLMTLMRLKLGLVLEDICFRFCVSKTTCSRIINKWIYHLYVHLAFLTYWPTRGQVNDTMPSDFKESFPRTRVVIDCTELFTETPRSRADQSLMFSQYKTHMTWKALIGITPNGVVSFVSDLWAGSISDKQIVSKSNILDLCEKGDAVMGDKGFLISELTTPKGIELIIPPHKKKGKQMSQNDITLTRRVANVRIHVERHMERVKNFRVLQNLTGTMKANVSKIWKICNHLTALQTPLHAHDRPDEDDLALCNNDE